MTVCGSPAELSGSDGESLLVLLHGGLLNRHLFLGLQEALGPRCTTLALDLPGFGDAAPLSTPMSLCGLADSVAADLEACPVARLDLVGVSLGAGVAAAIARKLPGRVRSVSLIGIGGSDQRRRQTIKSMPPPAPAVLKDHLRAFAARMLSPTASEDQIAAIWQMACATRYETIVALYELLARYPGVPEQVSGLTRPTLIATGEHDLTCDRKMLERTAASIGASFATIPDAGHLAPYEQPQLTAALLERFLCRRSCNALE